MAGMPQPECGRRMIMGSSGNWRRVVPQTRPGLARHAARQAWLRPHVTFFVAGLPPWPCPGHRFAAKRPPPRASELATQALRL